jgi:hypothetical protein
LVPVDDIPDFLSASAFSLLAFFSSSTRCRSSSESVWKKLARATGDI